jgi:hypothetical protein
MCAGCIAGAVLGLDVNGGARAQTGGETCGAWEVEYALLGKLRLSDTPLGAGNGVYPVGPGRLVMRLTRSGESWLAELISYDLRENFKLDSKALFWAAHVTTYAVTRAASPDGCSAVASGVLSGRTLQWTSDMSEDRTEGVLECEGSLCGSFGAPPAGRSALHIAPHAVRLKPFEFGPDMRTFTMAEAFVAKTEQPKQTASLTLSGREVRRTCAGPPRCL